jgi:predicted DNA-binding protein (UPF0251 family)
MCRGRPRCQRRVENIPDVTYFKPKGAHRTQIEVNILSVEELESVRLVDHEGLEQEQAATKMGISRRVFWDDLQSARKKIADALVNGKAIEIKGGHFMLETKPTFRCDGCGNEWEEPFGTGKPRRCPRCESGNIRRDSEDRGCCRSTPAGRGGCCRGGNHRGMKPSGNESEEETE